MSSLTDVIAASETPAFNLKDEILGAFAAIDPPIKTVEDLKAHDGRRLLGTPQTPG